MDRITVVYHHEDGAWWAESPDLPEFSAVGSTIAEVRHLVHEGIEFYLDRAVSVDEELESGARLVPASVSISAPRGGWWTEKAFVGGGVARVAPHGPVVRTTPQPVSAA